MCFDHRYPIEDFWGRQGFTLWHGLIILSLLYVHGFYAN